VGDLRIVLVEPREAGNVGAAARAMKNFGFECLTIVGSHPELEPLAGWWASGADDVVAGARFAATLHEALRDAHATVATTSGRGRSSPVEMTPPDVADLFCGLGPGQTLALVFGREDRGLTREESMLCQRAACIPTSGLLPTMNLAQAVSIFCYQIAMAAGSEGRPARERAPAQLIARLHDRLEALLVEAGFLQRNNPDRIYDDIRAIVGRCDLDEREATILLGMVRQIEWRMGLRAGGHG
jgi:tRNA/rRNA methyltransferase